jgi:hypothetical protein
MGIEGRVAQILNTRELIINRGSQHGVDLNMEFAVQEPRLSITDPETQEFLGDLEREKIRVRVSETHPRFSVARTYETYQELNPDSMWPRLFSSVSPYVTKVKKINTQNRIVDREGIANVNVGDLATQVPEPSSPIDNKDDT